LLPRNDDEAILLLLLFFCKSSNNISKKRFVPSRNGRIVPTKRCKLSQAVIRDLDPLGLPLPSARLPV
jgi:hypothetical protein